MATPPPPPPPPPPPNSGVRVRVSILHLLFLVLLPTTTVATQIPYAAHCNTTVPFSTPLPTLSNIPPAFFQFSTGHFSGAPSLLAHDPSSSFTVSKSFQFTPRHVYTTTTPSTVKIDGSLVFYGGSVRFGGGRRRLLRFKRIPWGERRRGSIRIKVEGFWSESEEKICMVGEGRGAGLSSSVEGKSLNLSAVFVLDYPKRSNVRSSLVYGSVRSLDDVGSVNYFGTIDMLVYAPHDYEYTLVPQARGMGDGLGGGVEAVAVGGDGNVCSLLNSIVSLDGLKLEYGDGCVGRKCGVFNGSVGNLPRHLSIGGIECSKGGMVHLYLSFSNLNQHGKSRFVEPGMMLVGEGVWNDKRNRLSLVVCRVLHYKEVSSVGASVGDCTIGVSLWFPKFLSITKRSILSGRIWSNRSSTDPDHFEMISFHDVGSYVGVIPGMTYKFTRLGTLRKSCVEGKDRKSTRKNYIGTRYPRNLKFDISVKNNNGKFGWGSATPLSIGNTLYNNFFMGGQLKNLSKVPETDNVLWNVSYKIRLFYPNASLTSKELTDISAEGLYNLETRTLCMVGCHDVMSLDAKKYMKKENLMDCSIAINIQLSPSNHDKRGHISGIIRSTRRRADPLYFKPLEISSYAMVTAQTIWRMDIELIMVLISLTLSCVFTGLQLFHVRKRQNVVPSISLTMLVILSLGHMIPLMLNFEALSLPTHKKNVLLWSGGWLEANEVRVRIVTMVALLLQLRLLQLTWSARSAGESKKILQSAERKALQICLPLYVAGIFSAWFVHSGSRRALAPRTRFAGSVHSPLWVELMPYAGLVLDGFLLPQIIVNVLSNAKDKSLAPALYFGTTFVRSMPHIYDVYRAHHYIPHLRAPYVYASPDGDFFSTVWDIIIPCGGVLFAIIVYLQQRFGGSCIIPSRFRKPGGYETVPVVGA